MSHAARPETPRGRGLVAGLALTLAFATAAPAGEKLRVEGLVDAEAWNTDGASRYLSRNEDETAGLGRLRLWAVGQFHERLQGFALGELEDGDATDQDDPTTRLEQAYLRYSFKSRMPLIVEAGKIATPLGNFSRRYFSDVNPLIGEPSSYGVTYPTAIQLRGVAGKFDGVLAVLDRPMVNEHWVPESDSRARPGLAAGFTPVVGTRFGLFGTWGPYLGDGVSGAIPAGNRWQDYGQKILGFDLQFSRGYFELNGEFTRSNYQVPGMVREARGVAWFIEPKYTFTPRIFGAVRYERNDYPFIKPLATGYWIGSNADFSNVELAAGYRFAAGMTMKVAYREDRWHVHPSQTSFYPNGRSIALQLSYRFDVNSWFDKPL